MGSQLTAEATPANPKKGAYGGQVDIIGRRLCGWLSGRVCGPQPAVVNEAWITGLGNPQTRLSAGLALAGLSGLT